MKTKKRLINCGENLWRDPNSKIYLVRLSVKIGEKWKKRQISLETDKFTVAKLKQPRAEAQIRAKAGRVDSGKMTLGVCAAIYLQNKITLPYRHKMLQPRSITYREETVELLRKNWPEFDSLSVEAVTEQDCLDAATRVHGYLKNRVKSGSIATRFNGAIQSMRGIFEVAVDKRLIDRNPARKIQTMAVPRKDRSMPDRELRGKIFMRLDGLKSRRFAAKSIRALAFTGLRRNEARHIESADVTIEKVETPEGIESVGTLRARITKNGKARVIVLIPQAVELFEQDMAGTIAALKKDPRTALRTVCRELGIKRLTPHDFRVLFSTCMDEAGVGKKLGAETMGHQDRGEVREKFYIKHAPVYVHRQMKKVVV